MPRYRITIDVKVPDDDAWDAGRPNAWNWETFSVQDAERWAIDGATLVSYTDLDEAGPLDDDELVAAFLAATTPVAPDRFVDETDLDRPLFTLDDIGIEFTGGAFGGPPSLHGDPDDDETDYGKAYETLMNESSGRTSEGRARVEAIRAGNEPDVDACKDDWEKTYAPHGSPITTASVDDMLAQGTPQKAIDMAAPGIPSDATEDEIRTGQSCD